jgi:hypothetical protein
MREHWSEKIMASVGAVPPQDYVLIVAVYRSGEGS